MPKTTPQKSKIRPASRPAMPFMQFQVVEVRQGREWTLYVLDNAGALWCRYWIENDYDKRHRYIKGEWGEWMPLDDDRLA